MQRLFNCVAVLVLVALIGFQYATYSALGWNNLRDFCNERTYLRETKGIHEEIAKIKFKSELSNELLNRRIEDALEASKTNDLAIYERLQRVSVKVIVPSGSGSGVLFCRRIADEWKTFVWTAGHVVDGLQQEDGSFANATVLVENRVNGEFVDTKTSEARVIAFSDSYDGEDLALLEIVDPDFAYWSTEFAGVEIQPAGTEIIHVGCTAGMYNSVSLGIISQTDRDLGGRNMYDQTSSMAYPGSSGGGVYMRDGKCIGLLTRGIGPGLNFFVPMRRIRAWAKQEGIEWALDRDVAVPLTRDPTRFEEATWPSREPILPAA